MSEHLINQRRVVDCASEEEMYAGTAEERPKKVAKHREQQHFRFEEISSYSSGRGAFSQANLLCPSTDIVDASLFADNGCTEYAIDVQGYPFIMPAEYAHPLGYYQLVGNGINQTRENVGGENTEQLLPFHREQQNANDGKAKSPQINGGLASSAKVQQNVLHVEVTAIPSPFIQNHHHHQLNKQLLLHNRSPFEPFCTVRMSLLSGTTKYKVSIGEIQRRINPPECLNASLIGGILRKAKSKDGGKALRESLKRIGLALPAGRRKSACVTVFTSLVEEEAIHMANDFNAVLLHDFPSKDIGFFLNAQFLRFSGQSAVDTELVARRRAILNCSRIFIKELNNLLAADRSPICDRRPELVLDPGIQKQLTHFSMITHGFGGIAMLSLLEALTTCLDESLKTLDKLAETSNVQQQ